MATNPLLIIAYFLFSGIGLMRILGLISLADSVVCVAAVWLGLLLSFAFLPDNLWEKINGR